MWYRLIRPALFALDAERAHRMTIALLKAMPRRAVRYDPRLAVKLAEIDFPSPVGLAAGFDKNAEVPAAMLGLGFGFVETGSVTPLAQPGNPKPRLFRLTGDAAVINRMGFNNDGAEAVRARLTWRCPGIVGANIGANKDAADRIADYVAGVRAFREIADYLAINISSPNTPGLRALQDEGALNALLAAIGEVRGTTPIFLKVAPDLTPQDIDTITRAALRHRIDALIVGNTTVSRPPLRSRHANEAGGLSGAPLKNLALTRLRDFRSASGGALPLIAAGGIANADDAWARIRAGASLVQLYTALIFEGPGLVRRIAAGLTERLTRAGFASVAEAVGAD